MATLAVVALVLGSLQHLIANDPSHMPSMGPGIALGIGAANLIAAWFLFGPIRRGLAGRGSDAAAMTRVARLPWLSALWTFVVTAAVMALPFVADYFRCPGCAPVGGHFTLVYQTLLMSTHAALMALFIYFLVDDYASWLKVETYRLRGWEMALGRGGGVVTKLLVAYFATAAVPFALIFLDVFFADQLEALQMLDLRQAFLLDLMGAVAMTGAAVVFIRRGLVRPLAGLMAGVQRVDAGNLDTHAPIVSDDELGVLTDRFNQMVGHLREKDFLRETFGRYVPKRVAEAILANRGALKPQQRVATILFTDIQDFTQIAEGLPPDRLVALLNEYFSQLMDIVERYGGVVTQLQGDALLVSFNVPLEDPAHAANAVRAALDIERSINHRSFGDGVQFVTRVGINTGRVIAGPVGAEHRLIYTVHGDAVNLAARLEALNKEHGTRILISESTRRLAGGDFAFTALGEATVRGKSEPVPVYTVAA
jgi:class 3 adenylate cyclase